MFYVGNVEWFLKGKNKLFGKVCRKCRGCVGMNIYFLKYRSVKLKKRQIDSVKIAKLKINLFFTT